MSQKSSLISTYPIYLMSADGDTRHRQRTYAVAHRAGLGRKDRHAIRDGLEEEPVQMYLTTFLVLT